MRLNISDTNKLKGIAIILVIACHALSPFIGRIATPLGGIGVFIFLLLSGYGLNESYMKKGINNFWSKKCFRVFLPYIILQLITFKFNNYDSLIDFGLDLSCLHTKYWFIEFILYSYIVFWISTKFFNKYRIYLLIVFSFISMFFFKEIEAEQSFSFVLGIIFSSFKDSPFLKILQYKIMIFVLVIIGVTFLLLKQLPLVREYNGEVIYNIIQLFIKEPLGLAVILLYDLIKDKKAFSLLEYLGVISYELYLIHMKFMPLFNSLLMTVISLLLSLILAIIYNKLVKIFTNFLVNQFLSK